MPSSPLLIARYYYDCNDIDNNKSTCWNKYLHIHGCYMWVWPRVAKQWRGTDCLLRWQISNPWLKAWELDHDQRNCLQFNWCQGPHWGVDHSLKGPWGPGVRFQWGTGGKAPGSYGVFTIFLTQQWGTDSQIWLSSNYLIALNVHERG